VSYVTFASPLRRLKPITRRLIPQVSLGLHSRGGSPVEIFTLDPAWFIGGRAQAQSVDDLRDGEQLLTSGCHGLSFQALLLVLTPFVRQIIHWRDYS
jgi:hypothetical protein